MSQLYRFVPRPTSSLFYVSRANAHSQPSTAKSEGDSTLPGAQTAQDKTNPTKTSEDAKQSSGPDKAHESIFKSPAGILGVATVALVSVYAAYKMLLGNAPDQKANFRDKQALLTRPDLQSESDVHAKLAVEHHSHKPREAVNTSANAKSH